eukprot:850068-Prymnesium_polylepis.3
MSVTFLTCATSTGSLFSTSASFFLDEVGSSRMSSFGRRSKSTLASSHVATVAPTQALSAEPFKPQLPSSCSQ